MNRTLLLPSAYLLDQVLGDPEWFPHPVRLIGQAISRGESALRHPGQTSTDEFIRGAALAAAIVGSTYWVTSATIRSAYRHSEWLGVATELLLAWTCLAARNLQQEAMAVTNALHSGDLPLARTCLARIVGRDTANLNASEISRAMIETVAESASDGIVAPLSYMALGGVPLAMAYKAVNTLDSMIGHADKRYFYFGKVAARLDDAANFIPSRVTALAIILASCSVSPVVPSTAWQIWRRDAGKHKSPNAGQPESAMAGALRVTLGGNNTYAGEPVQAQRIAEEFGEPTLEKAVSAIHLVSAVSLLGLGLSVLLTCFVSNSRRRH